MRRLRGKDTEKRRTVHEAIRKGSNMRSSLLAARGLVKQSKLAEMLEPRRLRAILWRMEADLEWMRLTIEEARSAGTAGEVPIGAILVHEHKVIARSGNRTIRDCDPTAHAEIVVLREGARAIGNYRLASTTLYVSAEPCSMCAGAMIQARIPRLVYGCDDPKGGAVRSCFEILSHPRLNHRVDVVSGVLAADCAALLQSFFAARR